jgi:hypothetical protein
MATTDAVLQYKQDSNDTFYEMRSLYILIAEIRVYINAFYVYCDVNYYI